jgi:glycosyltransferase involved in cell wall biosynthesis
MRVLIAHSRYRSPGGEERHVDLLEQGLRGAGICVSRYERGLTGTRASLASRIALAAGLAYRPSAGRQLSRELGRSPADVVHFHNLLPHLTPSALRAAKQSGAATVLTIHNYRFACPAGTLLRGDHAHDDCIEGSSLACGLRKARGSRAESLAYGVAIELHRRLRLLVRWTDAYVAPSAFVASLLIRAGLPGERVRVISHGVPLEPGSPRNPDFGLFAGRLSGEKGLPTLLAASRLVPDVPLMVAGEGPLAPFVRARVSGAIAYAGRLSIGELEALRARAAFVVVPSEAQEVAPFAALEGLAAGVPVIATRMGGLPEIVRDGFNGVLVPPGDPEALAAAMRSLWANRGLAADLGANARQDAAERFSLERQTARLVELYEEVAA